MFIFFLSLTILFGFYFIYEKVQVKEPIVEAIDDIAGVQVEDFKTDNKTIEIVIHLEDIDNFQETYHAIVNATEPFKGNRVLDFEFKSNEDPQILNAWNSSYFYIAEAVAKHEYSLIPDKMTQMKKELLLDKINYSMDENNIFVDLHKGDKAQYFIIKRLQEVGDHDLS